MNPCIVELDPFYMVRLLSHIITNLVTIDDYAKDGGPGEVRLLCSFCHEPLRIWIKTNVNKFAISSHTVLKLDVQALRNYLNLICEYELYILPNKKVSTAKDHGKNYMKDSHPWSAIFSVIVYCLKHSWFAQFQDCMETRLNWAY